MKLRDLAAHLECRLEGDGDVEVVGVAGLKEAGPGDVTFLANSKYEKLLAATRASAVSEAHSPWLMTVCLAASPVTVTVMLLLCAITSGATHAGLVRG